MIGNKCWRQNALLHRLRLHQCRRYGRGGGRGPPNGCFCLLISVYSKILFLEYHITTRQQKRIKKAIITFNVILVWRFRDSSRKCWQPTAVHKCDAIIRSICTLSRICRKRKMQALTIVTGTSLWLWSETIRENNFFKDQLFFFWGHTQCYKNILYKWSSQRYHRYTKIVHLRYLPYKW